MSISDLPAVNASLNGLSAVLLSIGYLMIRKGRRTAHMRCMISAFATSTLFLVSYVTYHYSAGHTWFRNPDWFRPIYLLLLASHVVLAIVIVPMVLVTLFWAVRGQFESHKRIARWTWPIWMYVSVTGVLIYLLLYQIFPQG